MYAVTQPLGAFEVLPSLPRRVPQRVTHRYGLQTVIRHQGLYQVLHGAVEAGMVEEGAPAMKHNDSWVLPVGQQLPEQHLIPSPASDTHTHTHTHHTSHRSAM